METSPEISTRSTTGGTNVPFGETAQNTAQHLSTKQWGTSQDSPRNRQARTDFVARVPGNDFEFDPPIGEEVASAGISLSTGHAPGVDEVQVELLQLLDGGNQSWAAHEFHRWWARKRVPRRYSHTRVVSIQRKGRPQELDNYRPISLLTTPYEVYAAVLKRRLVRGLGMSLFKTHSSASGRRGVQASLLR